MDIEQRHLGRGKHWQRLSWRNCLIVKRRERGLVLKRVLMRLLECELRLALTSVGFGYERDPNYGR